MTAHALKTLPAYFAQVWSGDKTFEVRYDDRGYQKGDQVRLREWDKDRTCSCRDTAKFHAVDCARYTGREVLATIGYVMASAPPTNGQQRGFLGYGYVVFSLVDEVLVEPQVAPSPLDLARKVGA